MRAPARRVLRAVQRAQQVNGGENVSVEQRAYFGMTLNDMQVDSVLFECVYELSRWTNPTLYVLSPC